VRRSSAIGLYHNGAWQDADAAAAADHITTSRRRLARASLVNACHCRAAGAGTATTPEYELLRLRTIHVKTFFTFFFILVTLFTFLTIFLFFKRFFILKSWQSSERQALAGI